MSTEHSGFKLPSGTTQTILEVFSWNCSSPCIYM